MPFRIIRNDITAVKADAIVNTANPKPVVGRGTDSAIYEAAGREDLLRQRMAIGEIAPGSVRYTDAFRLKARYILHTVGPNWQGGDAGEREILRECYKNTLELAKELNCGSVAFPLISSGNYGFPKDEALNIALSEIGKFLLVNDMDIIMVVFDRKALELSRELMGDIEEFIDEHTAARLKENEGIVFSSVASLDADREERRNGSAASVSRDDLETILRSGDRDTFQQRLFRLIDDRGMDDVEVYKGANMDRKVFSKIRSNADYHPKKKTAMALGISLKLGIDEFKDLLARAGYALSPGSRADLIIEYFVRRGGYSIDTINAALFRYGCDCIG